MCSAQGTENKLLMLLLQQQKYSMLHHLQISQSNKSLSVSVRVYVFTNLAMEKRLHVLKAIATGERNKSFYFILVFISVSRVLNGNFIGVCKRVCACARVSLNICIRAFG